ncbi:MAG: nitrogenase cofactor biosynthesis protein NifB [Firmicutes bacterium]|nr:nitrogenase cofactor biosynthesis protein NifB [Bacillota bacterium]
MKCGGSCGSGHQTGLLTSETLQKSNRHPCYSEDAHHKYARMHLPVAPACNISCNYCYRKFDCVNESRPGVTSEVLSPEMAAEKFSVVKDSITNLSVIGIAGPGDALANWSQTRRSIELIKERDPDTVFCLSTNGLMLPQLADEIVGLGIRHLTVTMNALDPAIGALIYSHVIYQGKKYTGVEGAKILLDNQLDGIKSLAAQGLAVKVNIVMIKEINDSHIPEIVKKAKELGAFMTNIMPLIPAAGSAFADYPQTSMKELNQMRDLCQLDLHQMRHCRQCRADAIGMLGEDRSAEFRRLGETAKEDAVVAEASGKQYTIAVATKYGWLVDLHFGHASEFLIYQGSGEDFKLLEKRQVEKYCLGVEECDEEENRRGRIADSLADCDAVLSMRIGNQAQKRLSSRAIVSIETCDTVEESIKQAVMYLNEQENTIVEAV